MYNLIFGVNPLTNLILDLLNLKPDMIERYRDCGIDENSIWIYTRTGGDNREYHPNKTLTSHKNYIKDEDDSFDSTYAMYEFSIPDDKKEKITFIKELMDKSEMNWDRPGWNKKFKELGMNLDDENYEIAEEFKDV